MCSDICVKCGNTEEDTEMMTLPCCGKPMCYENCIEQTYCSAEDPLPCPECGDLLVWRQNEHIKEDCGLEVATIRNIKDDDLDTIAEISRVVLDKTEIRDLMGDVLDISDEELIRLHTIVIKILNRGLESCKFCYYKGEPSDLGICPRCCAKGDWRE